MKIKRYFQRFLDIIERVGNKLPDPFVLFVGLALLMVVVSYILVCLTLPSFIREVVRKFRLKFIIR